MKKAKKRAAKKRAKKVFKVEGQVVIGKVKGVSRKNKVEGSWCAVCK